MVPNEIRVLSVGVAAALIAACGGGGSGGSTMTSPTSPASQTGNVAMLLSDAGIETAEYSGKISAPDTGGFTLTRVIRTAKDDYVYTLDYIASATPNGMDGGTSPTRLW